MFYCEKCKIKYGWPGIMPSSRGKCECCDEVAYCYDVPSGHLPDPKEQVCEQCENPNLKGIHTCDEKRPQKPPLGVTPRFIAQEMRFAELKDAIERYSKEGFEINPDWITEYNELRKEISDRKKLKTE